MNEWLYFNSLQSIVILIVFRCKSSLKSILIRLWVLVSSPNPCFLKMRTERDWKKGFEGWMARKVAVAVPFSNRRSFLTYLPLPRSSNRESGSFIRATFLRLSEEILNFEGGWNSSNPLRFILFDTW